MDNQLKSILLILTAAICFIIWTYSAFRPEVKIDPDYLAWIKTTATMLIGALVNHVVTQPLPKE